jgi:hypothetical protein
MEPSQRNKNNMILNRLIELPQKIVALHETQNVPEFLLHELCKAECFDLKKAAYLVDNPDFNCLKGVAGFCADQMYNDTIVWETPELFSAHMQKAPFNQQVRSILHPSKRKSGTSDLETTKILGDYLGMDHPAFCTWPMKHDNHGILIYQANPHVTVCKQMLVNGACLLSFCPIH